MKMSRSNELIARIRAIDGAIRPPAWAVILWGILLIATGPAHSDTYVQQVVTTQPYRMDMSKAPAPTDTVRIWLGKDRAAISSAGTNAILRVDQSSLYLLNHATRTYMIAPYPCDLLGLYPAGSRNQMSMRELLTTLAPNIEVTPTNETKVIRGYPTRLYRLKMSAARTSIISESWTTTAAPLDAALLRALMKSILSVLPSTKGLSESLDKIEGVTVLDEQRITSMAGEMLSIRELTDVREGVAPPGTFEVPAGYARLPFEPLLLRQ